MSPASDRVVVITGAAGGIGTATAQRFAREGARLVLADRDVARLEALRSNLAVPTTLYAADLTEPGAAAGLAQTALAAFEHADVLVNAVGVLLATPLEEISPEEWEWVVSVNLTAVFFSCQAFLPTMRAQRYGRIISMASLAGQVGGMIAGAHYAAAKAGVIALTRSIAKRYAEFGVTANALAPSAVETEMLGAFTADQLADLRRVTPLHRFTQPEEIADTIAFLASEAAATITGHSLNLNGGLYFG
jgi:NAD(P)-dependent dehydrogenase (short-subunit alcohol dehydrogenase family)